MTVPYPLIRVHFVENATLEEYTHTLGQWEIEEYYSIAIGLAHAQAFPDEKLGYEYLAVERILIHYFGEMNPRQVIALLHWSLQSIAPAHELFQLADEVREEFGGVLPAAEELYDYCRTRSLSRGLMENIEGVIQNIKDSEDVFRRHGNLPMADAFFWYLRMVEHHLRLSVDLGRRFPIDTFVCENSRLLDSEIIQEKLNVLFTEIPVPMAINHDDAVHTVNPDDLTVDAAFLIRSLNNLVNHIWGKPESEWPCPIHRACPLPFKDDTECLT